MKKDEEKKPTIEDLKPLNMYWPKCPTHKASLIAPTAGVTWPCPVDGCRYFEHYDDSGEDDPAKPVEPKVLEEDGSGDYHHKKKGPPILCFEEDLDAGLAAAKELATKGHALLADGFWHVTPGHMARLKAQVKHLQSQMVKQLAGNWDHVGAIDVAFAELYKLLPGGDK